MKIETHNLQRTNGVACISEEVTSFRQKSSSSSYRAGSTDIPDPLSPLLLIVHRPR